MMLSAYPKNGLSSKPSVSGYELTISSCERDLNWDNFVAQMKNGRQAQTSQWANIKIERGWQVFRLMLVRNGRIMAGAQALVRPVLHIGRFAIVAHGPLIESADPELASMLIEELLAVSQRMKLSCLVVQPPPNEEFLENELKQHQFYQSPAAVAPTADTVLDLSQSLESILNGMRRQSRQNVRRSQRDGMVARHGGRKDVHTFYQLHCATSQRQGFSTYSETYYQEMWDCLAPENGIHIFIGSYEGRDISALLLTAFGDRVYAKSSGWSGDEQARRPNEAVFWAAIEWAKTNGYRYFDFEGFDRLDAITIMNTHETPTAWHNSSSFFKYGFGGELLIYPLAYHYIFNPMLRWMVNQLVLPLVREDSPVNKLPFMRGLAQRFANQERTRD